MSVSVVSIDVVLYSIKLLGVSLQVCLLDRWRRILKHLIELVVVVVELVVVASSSATLKLTLLRRGGAADSPLLEPPTRGANNLVVSALVDTRRSVYANRNCTTARPRRPAATSSRLRC